jgi:Protein of unknown function (DUF4239)
MPDVDRVEVEWCMSLYWVYDYPNWMLFLAMIGFFSGLTVVGIYTFRPWTDKFLGITGEDNGTVSEYMSVTGVFFGLVLGMVAVGAWDAFGEASATAETEASAMASLYRSVAFLPQDRAAPLTAEVKKYATIVIKSEWRQQQRGIVPASGDAVMTRIGKLIYALPVVTAKDEIATSAATDKYFALVEARRHRIEAVNSSHLPGSLWWVVIASTVIILSLSLLMHVQNRRLDIALNVLMSVLVGTILSFIIAMDNPFRGELSVSAAPYQLIQDRLMGDAA